MHRFSSYRNILSTSFCATIKLLLRRTLVRSVILLNNPSRSSEWKGHPTHNPCLNKIQLIIETLRKASLVRWWLPLTGEVGRGFLLSLCFLSFTSNGHAQILSLTNLRCEYRKDPIGVDAHQPKFSWELLSAQKNVLQTAYRILVSDDSLLLQNNTANTWDSKKT